MMTRERAERILSSEWSTQAQQQNAAYDLRCYRQADLDEAQEKRILGVLEKARIEGEVITYGTAQAIRIDDAAERARASAVLIAAGLEAEEFPWAANCIGVARQIVDRHSNC